MFAQIASFEFRYQLRQPAFWVIAIILAVEYDLDSAFVTGGIHTAEFPPGADEAANQAALGRLCAGSGVWPTWVVGRLVW